MSVYSLNVVLRKKELGNAFSQYEQTDEDWNI